MDIYGDEGKQIAVANLTEDIAIDIEIDSIMLSKQTHNLVIDNSDTLTFHSFKVRNNDSILIILINPFDLQRKLEVFVKYGDFPSVIDYDWNTTIPHSADVEVGNYDLREEMTHRVFLGQDYIRRHGPGQYYIGIRTEGMLCHFS